MCDQVTAIRYEPVVCVSTVFTVVKTTLMERGIDAEAIRFNYGFERRNDKAWSTSCMRYGSEATLTNAGNAPCNFVVRKPGKRTRVFKIRKDNSVNVKGIVEAMLS